MKCSARSVGREGYTVSAETTWISCKNYLPEIGKQVLIVVDDEFEVAKLEETGPNGDLEWLYYDNWYSTVDAGRIQWWMPIPSMPENGK